MSDLKTDISALHAQPLASFGDFFRVAQSLFELHQDELSNTDATCRFTVTDKQESYGAEIRGGSFRLLADAEPAKVTISGKEADLLNLIRGKLSPAAALLFGKIRVKGDLSALSAFSAFIG